MANCETLLAEWSAFGPPVDPDEQAQFSMVRRRDIDDGAFGVAMSEALGNRPHALLPAFQGAFHDADGERFLILTLPQLTAANTERLAFETARCMMRVLPAESVRPILIDSLVGEAVISRPRPGAAGEAILPSCNTEDLGPGARGWAPFGLGVREAWKHNRGAGATIASIDTGYSGHRQLDGVISRSKTQLNLVENDGNATDRFSTNARMSNPGHGTLVMSVVASRGTVDADAGTGGDDDVTGTAPDAEILPIRAIRSVVDIRQSRIPAAIEHAVTQGCDVIVMALGSPFAIEPVEAALRRAAAAGVVTVCAAGNCFGPVVFPAKMAPLGLATAVAAVDYALQPWEKTSKGGEVTISAFGEAVWGAKKRAATDSDTGVKAQQGTTLATSLTAGVAALWVVRHGGRDALRAHARARGTTVQKLFNECVQKSAHRPSGWPRGMGAGLLNAAALLDFPLPTTSVPADVPLATDHVTPLKRFLPATVGEADALGGLEAGGLDEAWAAEALWRFYQASARRRAESAGVKWPPADPSGPTGRSPSSSLRDALRDRPHLRALVL